MGRKTVLRDRQCTGAGCLCEAAWHTQGKSQDLTVVHLRAQLLTVLLQSRDLCCHRRDRRRSGLSQRRCSS